MDDASSGIGLVAGYNVDTERISVYERQVLVVKEQSKSNTNSLLDIYHSDLEIVPNLTVYGKLSQFNRISNSMLD